MHAQDCATRESTRLFWLEKQGEPPDHPDHQIGYDHIVVDVCAACGGGAVEKLAHDCFDFEEVWDQYEWYDLASADGARLRELASRCERPLDPNCRCAVHTSLRQSAQALPSTSWSVSFENAAHRHAVSVTDGARPRFVLVERAPDEPVSARPAAQPAAPNDMDMRVILWTSVAMFVVGLVAYYRVARLPWFVDTIVTLVAIPASVLLAILLVAFVQTVRGK